jgi:hypothetical protein
VQFQFREDEVTKAIQEVQIALFLLAFSRCIFADLFFGYQQTIDAHLKDKNYEEEKVPQWINDICEDCVFKLVQLNKPFKYFGTLSYFFDSSIIVQIMHRH